MTSLPLPADYPRLRRVGSFAELVSTPFAAGVNALCWERELRGDFGEVVARLGPGEGITPLEEAQLRRLPLSAAGREAVAAMVSDLTLLRAHGLEPSLDIIHGYRRDDAPAGLATDVISFHADRAPIAADTYLCTYHGAPSEGLRNDEARRRIDVPELRAELLRRFGGEDDEAFREHLRESCHDLHYAPLPHARPFRFGVGHLWRIAVEHPESPVPPCIHRAPDTGPEATPRLLLIS